MLLGVKSEDITYSKGVLTIDTGVRVIRMNCNTDEYTLILISIDNILVFDIV